MSERTEWLSERTCDFCHEPISKVLYDAKTIYGPWATMCQHCYDEYSIHRLGLGLGQKYAEENGHFMKVEG